MKFNMKSYRENDHLVICLEGKITADNTDKISAEINVLRAENPGTCIEIDADALEYISSAGLRMLLTLRKEQGEPLSVRNVTPDVYDVFEITGFNSILNVKRKMREISTDGCSVIGEGSCGTVYRLDADTVVKVFKEHVSLPEIENEREMARQAFIKGIPTAIPFDIVRVGNQYGSVFEMLKATNCSDVIISEPEKMPAILKDYADFLKSLHHIEMEPGRLPEMRMTYRQYIGKVEHLLPENVCSRMRQLLDDMPADLHVVHGDIQLKNLMLSNGEMILIDMDSLSTGDPVFDFAGLFMTYKAFNEDEPDNTLNFSGLSKETCDEIWETTLENYFGSRKSDDSDVIIDKIRLLGYLRFLYVLVEKKHGRPELMEVRLQHTVSHLTELCGLVRDLSLKTHLFKLR